MSVKHARRGKVRLVKVETERGWYIMVGGMAVCSFHGPVHLHRSEDPGNPDHQPKVPVDPAIPASEAFARIGALCLHLDREPTFDELRRLLA